MTEITLRIKVLDLLEEASPVWLVADCECKNCYHTWVGVLHQDRTDKLECPKCDNMTGRAIHIYTNEEKR